MHIHILRLVSKVGEQDILLNFDLLKSYVVHVVSSKGIPTLSDHKVAFTHISSTYSLHPNVRTKRGGKAEVKEWAHLEALKLRSLVGALQRLARRTLDAKMHTKMMILKRLFAVQMLWIRDEPERATVDESEDRGHALVPADEADAEDDSERDADEPDAIVDSGHDSEPDASNDSGHDSKPDAGNDSGHDSKPD
ncbi:unnamed protein product, partial [Symbiodinium necroappetens]